jgi:hypothetical protein
MIRAVVEEMTDYESTARLATEAFATPRITFDGAHLRWFYEDAFSQGTRIIGLVTDDGEKVGQIALVRQSVNTGARLEPAAALVDLFIVEKWRGRERVAMLYEEVGRQFEQLGLRFAFGMPNAKALPVNERFFRLKPYLRLDLYMGLALPSVARSVTVHEAFDRNRRDHFVNLFSTYATSPDDRGLPWDGPSLYNRLCGFKWPYAIHATEDLLAISSPRVTRGIPHTLLCAFLRRTSVSPGRASVGALTRAATAWWKRPVHVYAGINKTLPALPGVKLPAPVRPSPLLLQMRDFAPERGPLDLQIFQLIDFDFG